MTYNFKIKNRKFRVEISDAYKNELKEKYPDKSSSDFELFAENLVKKHLRDLPTRKDKEIERVKQEAEKGNHPEVGLTFQRWSRVKGRDASFLDYEIIESVPVKEL